jgi:D-alanyl-D-alanine carboxypeptidase
MIAKYVAGSEAAFVELMNEKARSMGLTKTHFVNTTGLHDANHYTTCRELATIMSCAMNNPVAKKILTAYSGKSIGIYNANKVKYRNPTVYAGWYSDRLGDNQNKVSGTDITIIGGKTGYEDIPTATFVTVAENPKAQKQYVCVVAGRTSESQPSVSTAQSTADTRKIYKSYT